MKRSKNPVDDRLFGPAPRWHYAARIDGEDPVHETMLALQLRGHSIFDCKVAPLRWSNQPFQMIADIDHAHTTASEHLSLDMLLGFRSRFGDETWDVAYAATRRPQPRGDHPVSLHISSVEPRQKARVRWEKLAPLDDLLHIPWAHSFHWGYGIGVSDLADEDGNYVDLSEIYLSDPLARMMPQSGIPRFPVMKGFVYTCGDEACRRQVWSALKQWRRKRLAR